VRTPIGSIGGSLSSFSAPELGSFAVKAAVEKAGITPDKVQVRVLLY
jgi:acetyl-CoA C-acetyltransferase